MGAKLKAACLILSYAVVFCLGIAAVIIIRPDNQDLSDRYTDLSEIEHTAEGVRGEELQNMDTIDIIELVPGDANSTIERDKLDGYAELLELIRTGDH